jgi:L-ascorbate metabolism protein UlaG (beta-lactamase superfamily)
LLTPAIEPSSTVSPTATLVENEAEQSKPGVQVWSLGGNGWALRIGAKMLIFDYVRRGNPNPPALGVTRNLERGYIDPDELRSLDVYVFVTHSHPDHFDREILGWHGQIDRITYFFGWQAGSDPEHHYLTSPRAHTQSGSLEVYTINSHSDVPEVAYLVKVDGITVYHNGDYRGTYAADFEYLSTITQDIDIAFVIGWPYENHQHFQQAKLLAEIFDPTYMFAICQEGNDDKSREFVELLAEHGVETRVLYAEHRGEAFPLTLTDSG